MPTDHRALMIFAAGFGTRMGSLTADRPKPLLRLGGETLLDRAIALGEAAGMSRIVVNAHYLPEMVEAAVAGRGIAVSRETPDILDTGGGLRAALPLLRTRIVHTINPDALFLGPNPIEVLRNGWDPGLSGALLLLVPLEAALMREGGGDFAFDPDGRLTRGGPYVYTGAQIIDTGCLDTVPDRAFSLNAVWDGLAAEGRLRGIVYPGRWCDLGTPEALAHGEVLLADRS